MGVEERAAASEVVVDVPELLRDPCSAAGDRPEVFPDAFLWQGLVGGEVEQAVYFHAELLELVFELLELVFELLELVFELLAVQLLRGGLVAEGGFDESADGSDGEVATTTAERLTDPLVRSPFRALACAGSCGPALGDELGGAVPDEHRRGHGAATEIGVVDNRRGHGIGGGEADGAEAAGLQIDHADGDAGAVHGIGDVAEVAPASTSRTRLPGSLRVRRQPVSQPRGC
ncbi:MAG: hypothetical protein JST33_10725 [Actinobacteria bacterium]|nr:hypothetical protein [Actinomycetota bacterium]